MIEAIHLHLGTVGKIGDGIIVNMIFSIDLNLWMEASFSASITPIFGYGCIWPLF